MDKYLEILNLFIGNIIAYAFLKVMYDFIVIIIRKIILYLVHYLVYCIRHKISKCRANKEQ